MALVTRSFPARNRQAAAQTNLQQRNNASAMAAQNPWQIPDYIPGQTPQAQVDRNASWFGQFQPRYGEQMDTLLNNMSNFNPMSYAQDYSDPYSGQIQNAANSMQGQGFNANQLGSFMNQFNPGGGPQIAQTPWGNKQPPTGGQVSPAGGDPQIAQMNQGNKQPTLTGGNFGRPAAMDGGGTAPTGNPQTLTPPTMERPGYAEQFANTPTTVNPIQTGAGGQFNNQLLNRGAQGAGQFGGFGSDTAQARDAQLRGLMGQAAGQGLSDQQKQQLFSSQFDPVKQALDQAKGEAQNTLSGRGLGRSSEALGNINRDYMSNLTNSAQQIGAGLTDRDINLRQQQAQFGLSGLGDYSGLGVNAALGAGGLQNQMQGTANQYNLGLGNLGQGMEGQNAANQQWQQDTQFGQNQARAGMSGDLAAQRNQEMLNLYGTQGNLGLNQGQLAEQIAARQAGNQLDTMGYGLQAQNMQNQGAQNYGNFLLNASGNASNINNMNQGNLQNWAGMQQNQYGQVGNNLMNLLNYGAGLYTNEQGNQISRDAGETQRMQLRSNERAQARASSPWNAAAGVAGNLAGGWFGGGGLQNLFGSGQSQQPNYGTMPQGYGNQWNLYPTGGR